MTTLSRLTRNTLSILHAMADVNMITQPELISRVHLRRTSIFNVMDRMEKAGLIDSAGAIAAGKGRPTIAWKVRPEAGLFIVAHFGNLRNFFLACDFHGGRVHEEQRPYSRSLDEAVADLQGFVRSLRRQPSARGIPVRGVLAALGGVVDPRRGEVVYSHHWGAEHFPLRDRIEALWRKDAPLVLVDNVTRMIAWSEHCSGGCRETRDFLLLSIHGARGRKHPPYSFGLGSGIVLNGELFSGRRGGAGELDALFYRWRKQRRRGPEVFASLADMKPATLRAFARDLGGNFAHFVNYLAPAKVVVHFAEEPRHPVFVDLFRKALRASLLKPHVDRYPVEMSEFDDDAVLAGGAHRLRGRYFAPSEHLARQVEAALNGDA